MVNLSGMSVQELRALAKKAGRLADDLEKEQPSYALAIEAGIRDQTYVTTRYPGGVAEYSGTVVVTMTNGSKWRAVGHGPEGDAASVWRHGHIEFFPLVEGVDS